MRSQNQSASLIFLRLYKTAHIAHCNYRNATCRYPLIPQMMNGTGAIRQFVPKALGIAPGGPLALGLISPSAWRNYAEVATLRMSYGPDVATGRNMYGVA